jgi:hypothetical protein
LRAGCYLVPIRFRAFPGLLGFLRVRIEAIDVAHIRAQDKVMPVRVLCYLDADPDHK